MKFEWFALELTLFVRHPYYCSKVMDTGIQPHGISQKLRSVARKKSFQIAAGGLLLAGCVLALTNPDREDYLSFSSEKLYRVVQQECSELEQDIRLGIIALPTRDMCKSFIGGADFLGRGASKAVINLSTADRENYIFFSLYKTQIAGRRFTTLAVLGNFMILSSK